MIRRSGDLEMGILEGRGMSTKFRLCHPERARADNSARERGTCF
jgi:hypothetical protein